MRKITTLSLCLLAMPALHGCKKQLEEPLGSNDPAFESPVGQSTTTQRGPTPVSGKTNEAPLNIPQQDKKQADDLTKGDDEARHAKVELRGLTGEKLRGKAALKERANGVEIALEVENAAPGTRLVGLRDTGTCDKVEPKDPTRAAMPAPGQHAALPPNAELGALVVDQRGEGTLHTTLPAANLQAEQQGSLLGKTLVIYPSERITTDKDKGQAMIACAQILAD